MTFEQHIKELELHRFQSKTILDERNNNYKVLNKNIFLCLHRDQWGWTGKSKGEQDGRES